MAKSVRDTKGDVLPANKPVEKAAPQPVKIDPGNTSILTVQLLNEINNTLKKIEAKLNV